MSSIDSSSDDLNITSTSSDSQPSLIEEQRQEAEQEQQEQQQQQQQQTRCYSPESSISSLDDQEDYADFSERFGLSKPEVNNSQPEVNNSQPEVNNSQPEVNNSQPEVDNSQPEVDNSQPQAQCEDVQHPSQTFDSQPEMASSRTNDDLSEADQNQPETDDIEPEVYSKQPEVDETRTEISESDSGLMLCQPDISSSDVTSSSLEATQPRITYTRNGTTYFQPTQPHLDTVFFNAYKDSTFSSVQFDQVPEVAQKEVTIMDKLEAAITKMEIAIDNEKTEKVEEKSDVVHTEESEKSHEEDVHLSSNQTSSTSGSEVTNNSSGSIPDEWQQQRRFINPLPNIKKLIQVQKHNEKVCRLMLQLSGRDTYRKGAYTREEILSLRDSTIRTDLYEEIPDPYLIKPETSIIYREMFGMQLTDQMMATVRKELHKDPLVKLLQDLFSYPGVWSELYGNLESFEEIRYLIEGIKRHELSLAAKQAKPIGIKRISREMFGTQLRNPMMASVKEELHKDPLVKLLQDLFTYPGVWSELESFEEIRYLIEGIKRHDPSWLP